MFLKLARCLMQGSKEKILDKHTNILHLYILFACREGFEPPTNGFGDHRSGQTELPAYETPTYHSRNPRGYHGNSCIPNASNRDAGLENIRAGEGVLNLSRFVLASRHQPNAYPPDVHYDENVSLPHTVQRYWPSFTVLFITLLPRYILS